jgi:ATP diphosphatase
MSGDHPDDTQARLPRETNVGAHAQPACAPRPAGSLPRADGSLYDLNDLVAIMAALRTPESGCPWDLAQDFASIAPYTIEEAYEVADAIARSDMGDLCEELGDLLLQVVYHAQMAAEHGAFALPDVIDAITRKMIRRHPHVFGDRKAASAEQVAGLWQAIKAEEASARLKPPSASRMDGVPLALPGLTRSVKLQRRARQCGFDWDDPRDILSKVHEETGEVEAAMNLLAEAQTARSANELGDVDKAREHVAEELGDLLFVLANLADHLGVDPEAAVRNASGKFCARFAHIETALAAQGLTPEDATLAQMEQLWQDAKSAGVGKR